MRTIYIGRKNYFYGKTIWQILANLKNFGVGRMVTRNILSKYPEPSYHIIKAVEPRMDEGLLFGTVHCETVFRGKRLPGVRKFTDGYKPDFKLIPKDEEQEFLKGHEVRPMGEVKEILPKYYSVPPLMKEFLVRYKTEKGEKVDPNEDYKIPLVYLDESDANTEKEELFWLQYKIAAEGEQPNVRFNGKYTFYERYSEGLRTDG